MYLTIPLTSTTILSVRENWLESWLVAAEEEFDVTLVTYFRYCFFFIWYYIQSPGSVQSFQGFHLTLGRVYFAIDQFTCRAINIVVYYQESEQNRFQEANEICKNRARTRCIPYVIRDNVIPINKFKNMAIEKVITTHFLFVENNLSPTSMSNFLPVLRLANLYGDLLKTPGYLWRDPSFVGVVPVFEWASDAYDDAKATYQ